MLTCRDVIEDFLADYVEGTLSLGVRAKVKVHLLLCKECMAYLHTYKKGRDLFGEASRVEMPEEMQAILRRFLGEHLPKKPS
jgi:anti-sigma factor RsiW